MKLNYLEIASLGEYQYQKLILEVGDYEIKGIKFEGRQPLFSASDFLKFIGVKAGGSYYTHLLENSSDQFTFPNRKLGTYVSLDGMIKYSARVRKDGNIFLDEVCNIVKDFIELN